MLDTWYEAFLLYMLWLIFFKQCAVTPHLQFDIVCTKDIMKLLLNSYMTEFSLTFDTQLYQSSIGIGQGGQGGEWL